MVRQELTFYTGRGSADHTAGIRRRMSGSFEPGKHGLCPVLRNPHAGEQSHQARQQVPLLPQDTHLGMRSGMATSPTLTSFEGFSHKVMSRRAPAATVLINRGARLPDRRKYYFRPDSAS